MIVCHCNVIKRAEVQAVIRQIMADDPTQALEPHCIYRVLNKRGRCCCCFPTVCRIVDDMLADAVTGAAVLMPLAGRDEAIPLGGTA
ncbi:(2Fe-2S)-binding protein [Acuticoccus sediminis]|uniref:(2Fe-2S)-binding protein n=1 Tax=Acuticoccus sediminis TaxID=2184697 RepID=A0A8B2NWI2_9HYPH|nr:(2Fe-2S)-binding protein [Acuticoccus sediminis]RAI00711.1 (2Fe-2S)-binding protein [Acuticoccus sediminis]